MFDKSQIDAAKSIVAPWSPETPWERVAANRAFLAEAAPGLLDLLDLCRTDGKPLGVHWENFASVGALVLPLLELADVYSVSVLFFTLRGDGKDDGKD